MDQRLNLLIGVKEENLSELLKYHSKRNNLEVNTFSATSGEELREKLRNHKYHGVISDYYLGDETALNILKEEDISSPFIIHTRYHNTLFEQKALDIGASDMIQKKEHFRYFNKLLYKILELSDQENLEKDERSDMKFRINKKGEIIEMNEVSRRIFDNKDTAYDISDFIENDQMEETVQETVELGSSTAEVVFEDGKGLVNYRLCFKLLASRSEIAVIGIPMEELQKIDKEVYAEVSDISRQPVKD